MASPDNRELLAVVRAWAQTNYPGCPVEYITIHLRFLPVPVQLADSPVQLVERQEAEEPETTEPDQRHSRCIDDILDVLTKAGRPLTTTLIMSALGKAKKEWSQRYVEKLLAQMVRDGTIENPEGARPRGYRLPTDRHRGDVHA